MRGLWSHLESSLPTLTDAEEARLVDARRALHAHLERGKPIYGMTHGFGPLVVHEAGTEAVEQGMGLINHLGTSQGESLSPDLCRMVVRLRLENLRRGHSGVSPRFWNELSLRWCRGFIPVIQREGTVSASGDLQPLAQAALAFAGHGEAWSEQPGGTWVREDAARVLRRLELEPIRWESREALAFVNGTTVGLAATMNNHLRLLRLCRVSAWLTAKMARFLGVNPEAYSDELSRARGQNGQLEAAAWIRADGDVRRSRDPQRPLQEPYSLRCAPQVIGAVIDLLHFHGNVLTIEASHCTDNPVIVGDDIFHGGNFHAMPIALASDAYGLAVQQVAFLAERQLNLLLTPSTNGGLPPMLTRRPGAQSGFAGVQISATSFTSRIRQLAFPATLTTLPTNPEGSPHFVCG